MNLLSFTTGGAYGLSGYTVCALYSSNEPIPAQSSSDARRRHRLSGISPSLVLADEMDMIENRLIRLARRPSGETSRRSEPPPLTTKSSVGVGIEVSSRGGLS